ncbi:MAG TPA: VOC family protein, partial [Terriglobales bacterium]|nr:VOC family protein [Terriglobales bacterium]
AIEFYKRAFGAKENMRLAGPDGKIMHAEIQIGNAPIMLSDESPEYGALTPQSLGGSPVKIHLRVDDVDSFARHAVAEGAKLARPIADQFYGHRSGQLEDPFGYVWGISTTVEDLSLEEVERRFQKLVGQQPAPKFEMREGFRTVTAYIVAQNVPGLIEFLQNAFDAEETMRSGPGSEGGMHCEVRIGDSMLMIGGGGQGFAWKGEPRLGAFHLYVPDCDATYARALEAGAVSMGAPTDHPYGERSGTVRDEAGNLWYIATARGEDYKSEGAPTIQPYFHPLRGEPVINFLKNAFGATELGRYASPDGVIHHATLAIGDAHVELGEAHGPHQPMRSTFMLYVPDVDATYRRAIAAGAISMSEPADQGYGERTGAVSDVFGNQWYIATPIKG